MNTHYIQREIDDFSDAPEFYEHSVKKDLVCAGLMVLSVISMFVLAYAALTS